MRAMEQAKRPVTRLAGPYGHPIHPALVAVPIGAWIASFAFDLASHLVREPAVFAAGARWLIGIGVLGGLAAAAVGFLDLLAIPGGTRASRTALAHMAINLGVTGAYAIGFAVRGGTTVAPVGWAPLALSAVALGALGVSGYLGGKLAYRYGVRVADEATQAEGFHPDTMQKENV
jgi:uncharacterized membrane protein